jgi:hypothetical protein
LSGLATRIPRRQRAAPDLGSGRNGRADIERCCDELVDLAPAVRLRLVTELRAALDEVTTAALTSSMTAAKQQRWRLRRIGKFTGAFSRAGPAAARGPAARREHPTVAGALPPWRGGTQRPELAVADLPG